MIHSRTVTKSNLPSSSQVADKSPVPVLIYNFPAVVGGIDLDSDLLLQLAHHSNIVGTKLTCCNLGKLQRISANVSSEEHFRPLTGKSDAFLQGLVAGSAGVIGALVNLVPKVHVRLLQLYDDGDLKGARRLQELLSDADWSLVKLGVAGLKSALSHYHGYGAGRSRSPLGSIDFQAWDKVTVDKVDKVVSLEKTLE